MSRTVISLLFTLSLMPSVASAQSVFHCYPEIGTVGRRDFIDENGFVVKTIYYGSREVRWQPSCSERALRIQSVRTFERDALGRVMLERDGLFPELAASVVRYEYNSNERSTLAGNAKSTCIFATGPTRRCRPRSSGSSKRSCVTIRGQSST